jgi:pimeloyl-ACP methyl ester carboxylesterase
MPYVTVNGIKIWYEEHGSGETLLMMNPTGWPGSVWDIEQVGPLSEHFRIITYDPRGVGLSEHPDEDYTTALLADDTLAMLKAIDAVPAHVFGFSQGGRIAQVMVLRAPTAFRTLLLAGSDGGRSVKSDGIPLTMALDLAEHPYGEEFWYSHLVDEFPFSENFRANHDDKIRRLAKVISERQPPVKMYLRHVIARNSHYVGDRLSEIKVPTLVMVGSNDRKLRGGGDHVEAARLLSSTIPGAELSLVGEAARHLFPWEAPIETNRIIIAFLKRHARSKV